MMHWIGLDLGKRHDYAAVASFYDELESRVDFRRSLEYGAPASLTRVYNLDGLAQTKNMSYPAICERLVKLVQDPRIGREYTLCVDATGVGQPIVDMLREAGLFPTPITITGGQAVHPDVNGYNVPKADIVSNLARLFEEQRIKLPSLEAAENAKLPLEQLQIQIAHFKTRATPKGNITYGADNDEIHDDLVIACALPLWYAEWCAGFQSTELIGGADPEPYDPRSWLNK